MVLLINSLWLIGILILEIDGRKFAAANNDSDSGRQLTRARRTNHRSLVGGKLGRIGFGLQQQ
jgi:hypothetical protein